MSGNRGTLGAVMAMALLGAGSMAGSGFARSDREYEPPFKPRSNRKAALLEKALRRQRRNGTDDRP